MPRSLEEVIANADELSRWAEDVGPDAQNRKDLGPLMAVARASEASAAMEAALLECVAVARAAGFSWAELGSKLGTSGEAARQRYAGVLARREHPAPKSPRPKRRAS